MNHRQYIFSVIVGVVLLAMGLAIVSHDTVGYSLLALGLIITSLNAVSYSNQKRRDRQVPIAVRID